MKKVAVIFLHVGYWFLYILLMMLFIKSIPGPMSRQLTTAGAWIRWLLFSPVSTMIVLPGIIAFYTSYTFLFNRFLSRKRITALFLAGIAVCLASGIIGWGFVFIRYLDHHWSLYPMYIGITAIMSLLAFIHGTLGLVIRGF